MKRFVSNLVLGLFAVALIAVYGITKQPGVFSVTIDPSSESASLTTQDTRMSVRLPGGKVVQVSVAQTPEERTQGLSGVDTLAADAGMLLVFPQVGQHSIWMKGMKVPLDIIWLDDTGEVVHIVENAPVPDISGGDVPTYQSEQPAKYVLELAAGTVEAVGLEVGEAVQLS